MPRSRILARIPAFQYLAELFAFLREGTTVETWCERGLAMRTVVQLDGDVLTFATAGARDAKVRMLHSKSVEARLRAVARRLDRSADIVSWYLGLTYFLGASPWWFPWELCMAGWVDVDWTSVLANAGVSVVIGLAGRIGQVRRVIWNGLGWLIGRRT